MPLFQYPLWHGLFYPCWAYSLFEPDSLDQHRPTCKSFSPKIFIIGVLVLPDWPLQRNTTSCYSVQLGTFSLISNIPEPTQYFSSLRIIRTAYQSRVSREPPCYRVISHTHFYLTIPITTLKTLHFWIYTACDTRAYFTDWFKTVLNLNMQT